MVKHGDVIDIHTIPSWKIFLKKGAKYTLLALTAIILLYIVTKIWHKLFGQDDDDI